MISKIINMASKMAANLNFSTEKNIMCSTCVFVFLLSCKVILYCIAMCIYDFRPLLVHSEPKMASKMAVSI